MSDAEWAFEYQEQLRRVRWQLRLRWVAIGLVLLALATVCLLYPSVLPAGQLVAVLALLAASNLVIEFWLLPRFRHGHAVAWPGRRPFAPEQLIKAQIGFDLLVYTIFLHRSGGAENPAAFYYVLQVIIAAVLLNGRWAYISAGASTLLFASVLLLEYTGIVPHVHLANVVDSGLYRRPALLLTLWGVLSSAAFLAAYLAASIVDQLRQRERELSHSSLACELRSGELAAANRQLHEMEAARATFLRYVTHELRAPVAAIQSYLRLMREGYIGPERVPEIATRAERRAEEVLQLIADLLDLGQVEHARVQEGRERLDPRDVLTDALDLLRPSAVEKRLRLDIGLPPEAPVLFANPRHLSLLWTNLLSNAIKYTPADGSVRVALRITDTDLEVVVADTGIGIALEEQVRVFEEFYRGDAAKRFAPHGTGIGLAIVQRVVKLYEGRLDLESAVGRGSTFTVHLPLRALQAGSSIAGVAQPPSHLPRTLV